MNWLPTNGALHGIAVDRLMTWNLLALAFCFVFAHLWIGFALLRRRRGQTPRIWAVEWLPLCLLCLMYLAMAMTAQRLWANDRFEGPSLEALQVEAVGVQFQWYFRYPGKDATFGATRPELVRAWAGNPLGLDARDAHGADDVVSSELVLPAGREVDLRLRSHDVIHGLFIPGMRLKQNAVPGMELHVHFTPEREGEYAILCSQVCGLGHAKMRANLRVVSAGEYDAWIAAGEQRRTATEAPE